MKGSLAWIVMIAMTGLFLSLVITPGLAEAKTFAVNSALDETDTAPGDGVCLGASGFCTLRAAIQEANVFPGPDVIMLKAGLYMLTLGGKSENGGLTGDLDITQDVTIVGKGLNNTFINARELGDRVFHIRGSISVTMTDFAIQNGLATEDGNGDANNANGGGILNESGTLTLKGISVSNNTASGGTNANGGGIYNSGTLAIVTSNLSSSTMFNNAAAATGAVGGGAIFNIASLTIKEATISNNSLRGDIGGGGAISNRVGGTLTIKQTTISNNTVSGGAYGQGGGIGNNGTLTIIQSTISSNMAVAQSGGGGGAILTATFYGEKVTITRSIISKNIARGNNEAFGGAVCAFVGDVIITGSTLSYNTASGVGDDTGRGGGIFFKDGTLTVQSASKIVQNFASDIGGGLFFTGSWTESISPDSTVAKNIPNDMPD